MSVGATGATARFLRERAVRCRRYSDTTNDAAMRASLITLAVELEDHADELDRQGSDGSASATRQARARPPRYFFHLYNDAVTMDETGAEFANAEAAVAAGYIEARILAAEQVRQGRLGLGHRIEIVEEGGRVIASIAFKDAIELDEGDASPQAAT